LVHSVPGFPHERRHCARCRWARINSSR